MKNRSWSLAWAAPTLLSLLLGCTSVADDRRAWSPAERIDQESKPFVPAVALDAGGTAVVVWSDSSVSAGKVFSRRNTPDSGWSALKQIDRNEDDASPAKLAVNLEGNAIAVWAQGDFEGTVEVGETGSAIWSSRYTADGGWEASVRVDSEDAGEASDAHVALDADANAIAVWHQFDGTKESIWASRSTPDGGWDPPTIIDPNNRGHAGDPRVAIDPDGNAIAAWHQSDSTRAQIWSNDFTPGKGWGTATRIDSNNQGEARLPDVAMDRDGNAIVVWHQPHGSRRSIWSNRRTPSAAWGSPERIDAEDIGDADHARIGVDADGYAIAVWKQSNGITTDIWANRYVPGEDWGEAQRIEATDDGDALDPGVAVSASGDAVAVWPRYDGSRYDVWSNAFTPGEGWGIAERIDPSDQGLGQPIAVHVAVDPNGNAVAAWLRREPAIVETAFNPSQIWAARYE